MSSANLDHSGRTTLHILFTMSQVSAEVYHSNFFSCKAPEMFCTWSYFTKCSVSIGTSYIVFGFLYFFFLISWSNFQMCVHMYSHVNWENGTRSFALLLEWGHTSSEWSPLRSLNSGHDHQRVTQHWERKWTGDSPVLMFIRKYVHFISANYAKNTSPACAYSNALLICVYFDNKNPKH